MSDHINCFETNSNASMRLICFPYSGAASAAFRLWPGMLPDQMELCAVDFPGRVHLKDRPAQDMQELIDLIYPEFVPYFDKPCAFFAHSFGSIVAYEITKRLASQGIFPLHLFVSSRNPPHVPKDKHIYNLSNDDFVKNIEKQYGSTLPRVVLQDKDLLAMFLPVLKNDTKINETYLGNIKPPLQIPLTVYYGIEDLSNNLVNLEKWKEVTTGAFRIKSFPGGHFYIDTAREALIKDILDTLKRV